MAPSKKHSPDYLKSRMGTFLSPLFLASIVVLGIIGIAAWQLIAINNQFREASRRTPAPSRSGASVDIEVENVEDTEEGTAENPIDPNNATTDPDSLSSPEDQPLAEDPLDSDIREVNLFGSDDTVERRNAPTAPNQSRLYDQVLSLPRISPQITPSVGNGNGNANLQGLLSPEFNQQRQTSSQQIPIAPSPLNQAVSNVMGNYNSNRNIPQSQTPPMQNNIPSGGQYYSPPIQTNNVPSSVSPTVNPWTPTPQGMNQNQGSSVPPIGQVSRTNESPF
ncbi:hypothetical protein Cyast_2322 [Cyanobacterium stanieri PCC 7202]|uniref:Uncharacterized protein n=1 Tax=Cyanobacterium stanieri (strain ATCC 29140 / PCC 7202) TaxID=292563 RepID=K9YPE9_CYASC|nr:hypothetical protein Cyast_2322 [Cyanobacterium stanieri PCC 7202]